MAVAMEAARQLSPRRGGIVHMDELPVAISRSAAFAMIRSLGSDLTRPELRVRSRNGTAGFLITISVPAAATGPNGQQA